MFSRDRNEETDLTIGLLNEASYNESPSPSNTYNTSDYDIELKTFYKHEEGDEVGQGNFSPDKEYDDLQTESDDREIEQLERGQKNLMRQKIMQNKRKIDTTFSAIGSFKVGAGDTEYKVMGKVKYQPKWTELHHACARGVIERIQELINAGEDPNVIDDRGRTALDVAGIAFYQGMKIINLFQVLRILLGAGGRFNTMTGNIDCLVTPLHTAVELNSLEAIKTLLDNGASVACLNSSGLTPLHISIINKCEQGLKIHEPPLHLASVMGNRKILRKLITNNRNAINHFNYLGQSPLYIAIRSGKFDCVETLINMGADVLKVSNDDQNILHVALQYGFTKTAELLEYLDSDVVNKMMNSFDSLGYAPIHTAVANNRVACITLLGNKHSFLRLKTKGKFIADWTPLHIAAAKNNSDAANAILKFGRKAIDDVDHKGQSPIHLAASRCNREVMIVMLRNGAVLSSRTNRENTAGNKNTKDVTALEMISSELPNPTTFFEEVFDSFIDSYDTDITKNSGCLITMDYGVFTKADGVSQIEILEELVKCNQRKLLLHPLVESLIYLKWKSLSPLFCVIVSIYGFFALSLYGFIIDNFYHESNDTILQGWFDGILITPLIFIIIVEIILITIHRVRYFYQLENWAKIFSIMFAIILISTEEVSWIDAEWLRHVATIVLLLSWAQIMFLLSRFPYMGFYVLMFCKVSLNILKILTAFVFLLIAFSLSFMIQFHSKPPFDGPWSAFVKTVVMMTSEFEYDDLFGKDRSEELATSKEFVHIIFVVFLIFVSIVFVNFMLGVAVSDVNDLKIDGDIRRLEKQVEYLSTLDLLAYGTFMKRILKKDFIHKRYIKEIKIKAGVTKHWKVLYEAVGENDEIKYTQKEVSLPPHILDTIFQKIKSKKEQKEEEKKTMLYRTQIDMLFNTIIGNKFEIDTFNDRFQTKVKTKFDGSINLLHDLSTLSNEMSNKFDSFKSKYIHTDKSTQTDFRISASMRKSI